MRIASPAAATLRPIASDRPVGCASASTIAPKTNPSVTRSRASVWTAMWRRLSRLRAFVECLLEFTTGPLLSHPTAQACAAGTPPRHPNAAVAAGAPHCRRPENALEGALYVVLHPL